MTRIKFKDLSNADLIADNIYERGRKEDGVTGKGGDVLSKLLSVSNEGGFRKRNIKDSEETAFVAISLTQNNLWPNEYNEITRMLKYYGDNKEGTRYLLTGKKGNMILREEFDKLNYFNIIDTPFFVFEDTNEHDLKFLGLAVPGHSNIPPFYDLKLYNGTTDQGEEFFNYEAYFTILDTGDEHITRNWITSLVKDNENNLQYAPYAWKEFIENVREGIKPPNNYENRKIKNGCNKLYYGVPGSGKSCKINKELNAIPESQKERVLFHPDYTYSDFIGQILPKTENGEIKYTFTSGPFTRILKKAFHDPDNDYYLIIEEMNRGNAPAIF